MDKQTERRIFSIDGKLRLRCLVELFINEKVEIIV